MKLFRPFFIIKWEDKKGCLSLKNGSVRQCWFLKIFFFTRSWSKSVTNPFQSCITIGSCYKSMLTKVLKIHFFLLFWLSQEEKVRQFISILVLVNWTTSQMSLYEFGWVLTDRSRLHMDRRVTEWVVIFQPSKFRRYYTHKCGTCDRLRREG